MTTPAPDIAALVAECERIDLFFTSGNSVPVERAYIKADDWWTLRGHIERLAALAAPVEASHPLLEFAEYMAKGAERLLSALNSEDSLREELGECPAVDQRTELRCEHANALRDDIYEFRKRAALSQPPAQAD